MKLSQSKLRGRMCQCASCGELFSTTANFDRHRLGKFGPTSHDRHCATHEQMRVKMAQNERGVWRTKSNDYFTKCPIL